MTQQESAFHRAPRPLMGWGGVALVVICIGFLIGLAVIVMHAMWRWANGQPVDLMGFAAVLAQATAAGAAVWRLATRFMDQRQEVRMAEVTRGSAPSPFDPSPPSEPPPDVLGPRPAENRE